MIIGERIRQLRKEKNWSQGELGKKIGVDTHLISHYERRHYVPSAETILKIAKALDVSIDYLMTKEAPRVPFKLEDKELIEKFEQLDKLGDKDKASIKHLIDALLAKSKLKTLAENIK